MKKILQIGTAIHFLTAFLCLIMFSGHFLVIVQCIFGGFFLYFQSLDVEQIMKKKTYLLLVGIFDLPFNILGSIALFLASDKMQREYRLYQLEKKEKAPQNRTEKIDPEIQKIDFMLRLGVLFIGLSALFFSISSWETIPSMIKVSSLLFFSILFFFLSKFSENKLKLEKSTLTYYVLGMIFILCTYLSLGYSSSIQIYFSWNPSMLQIYLSMMCLLITLCSFLTYKKFFKKELYYVICFSIVGSIFFFLRALSIPTELIFFVGNVLAFIYLWFDKKEDPKFQLSIEATVLTMVAILIFLFSSEKISMVFPSYLLIAFSIINLLTLGTKSKKEVIQFVSPILEVILLLFSAQYFGEIAELKLLIFIFLLNILYVVPMLFHLELKNKTFHYVHTISMNIVFLIFAIFTGFEYQACFLFLTILMLLGNLIYFILVKQKDLLNFEIKLQPIKLYLVVFAVLLNLKNCLLPVSLDFTFIISSHALLLMYYLIKDEKLKKYYFITYMIGLISTIILVDMQLWSSYLLILITNIIPFFFIKECKTNHSYKTASFLLATVGNFLVLQGSPIVYPSELFKQLIIISYFLLFLGYCYFKERGNKKYVLTIFVLIIPSIYQVSELLVDNKVISELFETTIFFFAILGMCKYLMKTDRNRGILGASLASLALISILETGVVQGIYIGIITIIMIFIGFSKKEYKPIFVVGFIFFLLNFLMQFELLFQQVPFWIYLFLVGIGMILFVTYSESKKLK